MTRVCVLALTALFLSLGAGATATAQAQKTDRPDAGVPLIDPNPPRHTDTDQRAPGLPPPRSLDTKRAPVPDRLALPADMQDIPLAPPTPPIPKSSGSAEGGGPNRVKQILKSPGGGQVVPRGSATKTPEDQVPMPGENGSKGGT